MGDFAAGAAGFAAGGGAIVAATASALLTRPPGPVPLTASAGTPASPRTRAADGITRGGITGAAGG